MHEDSIEIYKSLGSSDYRIGKYIDYLLQDLWAIGTDPQKIVELIRRNIFRFPMKLNVLELCCGKGATLITVSKAFKTNGIGIDLHPPFIKDAIRFSKNKNVNHLVDFQVMNIVEAVTHFSDYDIVICGYDTRILGNECETLNQIKNCCKIGGHIIFESAYKSLDDLIRLISKSGLDITDKITYQKNEIKQINLFNTDKIRSRANELIIKYPEDEKLLKDYVLAQEKESFEMENDLCWVNFLLHNN